MENNRQVLTPFQRERERLTEKYGEVAEEHIVIRLLESVDKGTERLNCLTKVLITLTVVLAILTVIAIFKSA